MTRKQRKQRGQTAPAMDNRKVTRERYLLSELAKVGWQINPVGPYQFFIQRRAGAA